jgi:hypothetical protein
MLQRLGLRFWLTIATFIMVLVVVSKGPQTFRKPAERLTFTDEIQTSHAHAGVIMPASGMTVAVEERVNSFLASMKEQKNSQTDWSKLNNEWLSFARAWFERVYPGEERFNQYASLWVGKRSKVILWRLKCRNEFFPDLDETELIRKADQLKDQEEWQEMQAKISRGLTTVEEEYSNALNNLLGSRISEFKSFHKLFVQDFLSKKRQTSDFFL